MIGEAGHINSASGLGDWLEGLALLNTLRQTPVENLSGNLAGKANSKGSWKSILDMKIEQTQPSTQKLSAQKN
jgi:hypothetical protein